MVYPAPQIPPGPLPLLLDNWTWILLPLIVRERDGVIDGVTVGVTVIDGVTVGVTVTVGVGVLLTVLVGVTVTVGVGDTFNVTDGVIDGVNDGVAVIDGVGVGLGETATIVSVWTLPQASLSFVTIKVVLLLSGTKYDLPDCNWENVNPVSNLLDIDTEPVYTL